MGSGTAFGVVVREMCRTCIDNGYNILIMFKETYFVVSLYIQWILSV